MNIFKNLFPENLYHSYIVEGEPVSTSASLCEFLKNKEGKDIEILCQNYDSFAIADSELIKEWHSQKSIDGNKKICIIGAKFINHDAERTLLKMIEEPKENTHFFIIVSNSLILLDTIRSRTHIIKPNFIENLSLKNISDNQEMTKEVENFLKSSLKDRLEIITKIIKSHEDEENGGSLRYYSIEFLNEIEKVIYKKWRDKKEDTNLIFILEEIREKRSYLNYPGAGVKMILEHTALVI